MLTVGGSSFKPPEGCNVGLFFFTANRGAALGGGEDVDPPETTMVAVLGSG